MYKVVPRAVITKSSCLYMKMTTHDHKARTRISALCEHTAELASFMSFLDSLLLDFMYNLASFQGLPHFLFNFFLCLISIMHSWIFPLLCIILNKNQRIKNGGRPGKEAVCNLSCALVCTHNWDEHNQSVSRTTFSHQTMLLWDSLRLAQTITQNIFYIT